MKPVARFASRIYAAALLSGFSTQSVSADTCDPSLHSESTHPYAYQMRGDRCEGIYTQEVAGSVLRITSLTESVSPYDPKKTPELHLQWASPLPGATAIRAQGTRRRLYYRMDTVVAAGTQEYSWPTTVLAALGVRDTEIGILAWTQMQTLGRTTPLYLPLRVGTSKSAETRVEFVPGSELSEVFVTLAPVGSSGSIGPAVRQAMPLGYGFYPADRPVEILLPKLAVPGIYYLEIAARIASGGDTSKSIYFHAR